MVIAFFFWRQQYLNWHAQVFLAELIETARAVQVSILPALSCCICLQVSFCFLRKQHEENLIKYGAFARVEAAASSDDDGMRAQPSPVVFLQHSTSFARIL